MTGFVCVLGCLQFQLNYASSSTILHAGVQTQKSLVSLAISTTHIIDSNCNDVTDNDDDDDFSNDDDGNKIMMKIMIIPIMTLKDAIRDFFFFFFFY